MVNNRIMKNKTKVDRIKELLVKGESHRKIACLVGCSVGTVSNIRKTLSLPVPQNPAGRKKILSDTLERSIVRDLRAGKYETATEITASLATVHDIHVCSNTVRKTLYSAGLHGRAKVKKPLLTTRHKKLRHAFAKKYKHWTNSDWAKVLWSDESKINRFGSDGRKWTWKSKGESLQPRHVKPTLKFGGGSIMVWGSMMANGVGTLHKIDGHMTAEYYVNILSSHIDSSVAKCGFTASDIVFQQDNDPKHTAKITKTWFSDHEIKALEWPPQSPDLNPIEHLWGVLKRSVTGESGNIDHLWQKVQNVWDEIPSELCQNLVESMPRRIEAVLKSKGGYTKY